MNKKGQAAMEFLMTYGWAILVVLIALGALAAFGVFDMGNTQQRTDFFSEEITNQENAVLDADAAAIYIPLVNNAGKTVEVDPSTVAVTDSADETVCDNPDNHAISTDRGANYNTSAKNLSNGANFNLMINCTGAPQAGDAADYTVSFDYTSLTTGLTNKITGTVQGQWE